MPTRSALHPRRANSCAGSVRQVAKAPIDRGTNNWFVGASAALCSFAEWQRQNFRRLDFRSRWQAYFDQVDVFLSPVAFTTAFTHDHSEPQDQRTILTWSGVKPYFDVPNWGASVAWKPKLPTEGPGHRHCSDY
jgi:Asp-tRNA(Asn)/Glu-tRNA(Gln) amidotransferase A subunit family amidase